METKVIEVNPESPSLDVIDSAVKSILEGELVAFPTDTLYGVGCNAFDLQATKKLFSIKERPFSKPINLLISDISQIKQIVLEISETAKKLISNFWPGALTIIFPRRKGVLENISGGLNSIGIRMPNYIITLQIIKRTNIPLAATSANLSGQESTTTAEEVYSYFKDKIPLIIDGGKTPLELGSTIIDITDEKPRIVREGYIASERIKQIISIDN